jgi:hypothetical protein
LEALYRVDVQGERVEAVAGDLGITARGLRKRLRDLREETAPEPAE